MRNCLFPRRYHTVYETQSSVGFVPVASDWWMWFGRVFNHRLSIL